MGVTTVAAAVVAGELAGGNGLMAPAAGREDGGGVERFTSTLGHGWNYSQVRGEREAERSAT
ncbi:MAG: hypothetical protein ACLQU2_02410 [Candidatus Binataceae bacterium]